MYSSPSIVLINDASYSVPTGFLRQRDLTPLTAREMLIFIKQRVDHLFVNQRSFGQKKFVIDMPVEGGFGGVSQARVIDPSTEENITISSIACMFMKRYMSVTNPDGVYLIAISDELKEYSIGGPVEPRNIISMVGAALFDTNSIDLLTKYTV